MQSSVKPTPKAMMMGVAAMKGSAVHTIAVQHLFLFAKDIRSLRHGFLKQLHD